MSRINLLPWREELRKVSNRIFYAILGATVGFGVIIILLAQWIISYRIDVENANVAYLNKELQDINDEISQIQGLQESKENLLSRMRIIQALQEDRSSIVKLLDMIPRVVPESVYLNSIERNEVGEVVENASANIINNTMINQATAPNPETALDKIKKEMGIDQQQKDKKMMKKQYHIKILGVAQTNSGISNFMKNLQAIDWIFDIKYSEVSINKTGEGLNFKLEFTQKVNTGTPVNKKLDNSEENKENNTFTEEKG